jgi:hypothetical protein
MMADGSKSWSFSTPCPFPLRYRTLPSNYLINICFDLRSVEVGGQARQEVMTIAVGGEERPEGSDWSNGLPRSILRTVFDAGESGT